MSARPRRAVARVLIAALLTVGLPFSVTAAEFQPVTPQMLENPPAADWLQISRTYDEQRFSPLDQINKSNVGKLQMVFSRGLPPGTLESTPLVHDGVMYLIEPGANLLAIDATTGDEVWEYKRDYPKDLATKIRPLTLSRSKVPASRSTGRGHRCSSRARGRRAISSTSSRRSIP